MTPDEKLFRYPPEKKNVRVELLIEDAAKWFRQAGPIAEIYSPPPNIQEARLRAYAGTKQKSAWSLDLTTNDPKTGAQWDLGDGKGEDKGGELGEGGAAIHACMLPHVHGLFTDPSPECRAATPP